MGTELVSVWDKARNLDQALGCGGRSTVRSHDRAPTVRGANWVLSLQRQIGNERTANVLRVDPRALPVQRAIADIEQAAARSLSDVTPEYAGRLVAEFSSSPVSLAQFAPRRCLLHLMQEISAGNQTVSREELDRRSNRYASLVVVRPDGYWAAALTGVPLQRAFRPERAASPPYEIGRFYYSRSGVMYRIDAALQPLGPPVGELGLDHDVVNSALDGVEDAVAAMARGIAQLMTHPIRTIAALANLPQALAQLIQQSPEYWDLFRAMPLNDQVRKVAELVSTLLLMYGTAAGSTSVIGAAASDIGDITVNALRLQANGSFAVVQVSVPVGTIATAMAGGPGAVYVLAMVNASASGGQGGASGGGGSGSGNPPQFISAVRELDAADAAAQLTDVQRAALEWNAGQIAGRTGVPLTSGRIAWRSLAIQLARPRWRFLNQAPEAVKILRDMVRSLPDGPYAASDPTKADLLARLNTWLP